MAHSTANGRRANILLVALVLTITLSLGIAMAIRPLRTQAQRIKEQQLVYRGEHIAEGIRRFYIKFRRFPFELDELVESDPRFIRQLYLDPMTEDGEWTLVYLSPLDSSRARSLIPREENSENSETPNLSSRQTRQITGIRSKSNQVGLMLRNESQLYSDWLFSALPDKLDDTRLRLLQNQ